MLLPADKHRCLRCNVPGANVCDANQTFASPRCSDQCNSSATTSAPTKDAMPRPPPTLQWLTWFGEDFWGGNDHTRAVLPITQAHANLYKSGVLANISRAWKEQRMPALLELQGCSPLQPPNTSHATCERLIARERQGLTPYWRRLAAQIVLHIAPHAPNAPPSPLRGSIRGVMLGDELVLGGLPLSNLTSLANTLAKDLRPMGIFITTNEAFRWGTACNASKPCTAPSGAGPETCGPDERGDPSGAHPGHICKAAMWPAIPEGLDYISMDMYGGADEAQVSVAGGNVLRR